MPTLMALWLPLASICATSLQSIAVVDNLELVSCEGALQMRCYVLACKLNSPTVASS